jgi:predicted dehydrogenase
VLTREAGRLFEEASVDAVVLAAASCQQLELAAAACSAGKDVLLLRPLPFDLEALGALAKVAAQRRRQVQVTRATTFALGPGATGGLVAPAGEKMDGVDVEAHFQLPERPDAEGLLAELIDEMDFAQALVGGRLERSLSVGGPGLLPGRWIDRRVQFEMSDEHGVRRWIGMTLLAARGAAGPKASRIQVRGGRGAAQLVGSPSPAGDPLDLGAFLDTVRNRRAGAGLSLSRYMELTKSLSQRRSPE